MGVDDRRNSATSAKLRSAWMPPLVAQAPMVTSRRDIAADPLDPLDVLRCGHRALDQRHVVRALDDRSGGLREVGDLDLAGQREQLVLAVQQGQLAAVAGGELPDRQLGPGRARSSGSITAPCTSSGTARPVVAEHRAVDAQEVLAQLAVAAQADAALHVALHRQPQPLAGAPRGR